MPISCELIIDNRTLPDPAGGTFNAAGGFDRLLPMRGPLPPGPSSDVPILSHIDPDGRVEFTSSDLAAIAVEAAVLLDRANAGVETRGLARLRMLAEYGQQIPHGVLRSLGD